MKIKCNIDDVINYLTKMKQDGYRKVEIIDKAREFGWIESDPCIEFITCDKEPSVLGIDCRKANIYK